MLEGYLPAPTTSQPFLFGPRQTTSSLSHLMRHKRKRDDIRWTSQALLSSTEAVACLPLTRHIARVTLPKTSPLLLPPSSRDPNRSPRVRVTDTNSPLSRRPPIASSPSHPFLSHALSFLNDILYLSTYPIEFKAKSFPPTPSIRLAMSAPTETPAAASVAEMAPAFQVSVCSLLFTPPAVPPVDSQ